MEKLSNRRQTVLDVLDEQIEELEEKLKKAQPLMDELSQLRRTRQTLLSERSVTGSVRNGTKITMESVIHYLTEHEGPQPAVDIAAALGVDDTVVRSHLNRHKDVRYRSTERGMWELIGNDTDEDEEEDEDDA